MVPGVSPLMGVLTATQAEPEPADWGAVTLNGGEMVGLVPHSKCTLVSEPLGPTIALSVPLERVIAEAGWVPLPGGLSAGKLPENRTRLQGSTGQRLALFEAVVLKLKTAVSIRSLAVAAKLKTKWIGRPVDVTAGGSGPKERDADEPAVLTGETLTPKATPEIVIRIRAPLVGVGVLENPVSCAVLVKAEGNLSDTEMLVELGIEEVKEGLNTVATVTLGPVVENGPETPALNVEPSLNEVTVRRTPKTAMVLPRAKAVFEV